MPRPSQSRKVQEQPVTATFANLRTGKPVEIEVGTDGFIRFGDIAIDILDQQCQYASRYLHGTIKGYPALGNDLRLKGDPCDYHCVEIHQNDAQTFIDRYHARNTQRGL